MVAQALSDRNAPIGEKGVGHFDRLTELIRDLKTIAPTQPATRELQHCLFRLRNYGIHQKLGYGSFVTCVVAPNGTGYGNCRPFANSDTPTRYDEASPVHFAPAGKATVTDAPNIRPEQRRSIRCTIPPAASVPLGRFRRPKPAAGALPHDRAKGAPKVRD